MSGWLELFTLLGLVLVAIYWSDAMRSKERARAAGRAACEGIGAQFLDDTVVLTRTRLRRNAAGALAFQREYRYEYTVNGALREFGHVIVHGRQATSLTPGSGTGRQLH